MEKYITCFIGTYTKGESKGIYKVLIDIQSLKFKEISLAYKIENPTYLALSDDKKLLYSVMKDSKSSENIKGGIASFSLKTNDYSLRSLNNNISLGAPPCHIFLDNNKKNIICSNYHRGTLELFNLNENGCISNESSIKNHNIIYNSTSHVHYSSISNDGNYIFSVDLGLDKLITYRFTDGKIGDLVSVFDFPKGSGPRHMIFHPNGKFAYIVTELSSEVIVLNYSSSSGSFEFVQAISTLPKDYSGENYPAAIHIDKLGTYLYVSNRGHDSIGVFSIDSLSYELKLVSHHSTLGKGPRDFSLDPSGEILIAANEHSNNISCFSIDKNKGSLTPTDDPLRVPSPVCIKFI
ncbi:lactonase family protein [Clostridium hydrogeniformans]|uniref:lactonase family protein n=1 Tax=Clostridium hydrogeniformans TaxID=349933 RepID=UPI000488AA90|nr:lactonase family protein [Clostridium hydrogeniformans]